MHETFTAPGTKRLLKTAAQEDGPKGATSNYVRPDYVRTPLIGSQNVLTEAAIERLVEPEEVVAPPCSPAASFVNDASPTMDGGWTAR